MLGQRVNRRVPDSMGRYSSRLPHGAHGGAYRKTFSKIRMGICQRLPKSTRSESPDAGQSYATTAEGCWTGCFAGPSTIRPTPMTTSTTDPTRNPTRWLVISSPSVDIATACANPDHAVKAIRLRMRRWISNCDKKDDSERHIKA